MFNTVKFNGACYSEKLSWKRIQVRNVCCHLSAGSTQGEGAEVIGGQVWSMQLQTKLLPLQAAADQAASTPSSSIV
jgi:hypothetical protein